MIITRKLLNCVNFANVVNSNKRRTLLLCAQHVINLKTISSSDNEQHLINDSSENVDKKQTLSISQASQASQSSLQQLPEPPDNCCMSGCANCVWIQYAQQLTQIYRDGGQEARQQIDKFISDENLKMFLKTELKS